MWYTGKGLTLSFAFFERKRKMDVIVCLDDRNGMLFNHRRQSRDRKITEDILCHLQGRRLLINSFSAPLFAGKEGVVENNSFLQQAGEGDICFVEDQPLRPYEEKIGELIVYRWNRLYPADISLDISLSDGWQLCSRAEFAGNSHEKITKEIYKRCRKE